VETAALTCDLSSRQEGIVNRERALKIVLVLVGLIFLIGVYPLMMFPWSSGWRWQPNQPEYEQMILGVYATLGIFLCSQHVIRQRIAASSPSRRGRASFTPLSWLFRHFSMRTNGDICWATYLRLLLSALR